MMDIWNALVLNALTVEKRNLLIEKRSRPSSEDDLAQEDAELHHDRRTQEYLAYLYHPSL